MSADEAVSRAVCQAVTGAGRPCKARPLTGESFCALHMPDADPRAMGAKGGRTPRKQLTDREKALAALRRALESNNAAAVVAAAKGLIDNDTSPIETGVSVVDARAQLYKQLDDIEARRRAHGETCSACGGAGYVVRVGAGAGGRDRGGRGHVIPRGSGPEEISEEPPRTMGDGPQGALRPDIRSLDPARFEADILRRQQSRGVSWGSGDDEAA